MRETVKKIMNEDSSAITDIKLAIIEKLDVKYGINEVKSRKIYIPDDDRQTKNIWNVSAKRFKSPDLDWIDAVDDIVDDLIALGDDKVKLIKWAEKNNADFAILL